MAVLGTLVLAGCQAPMGELSGNQSIAVQNGTLSTEPDRIYPQIRTLMDADVGPPERIVVLDNATAMPGSGGRVSVPRFQRLVGLAPGEGLNGTRFERMENGATFSDGRIYILPGAADDSGSTEWVVAHEFVHYMNLRLDRASQLAGRLPVRTADGAYVARSLREGMAVLTTDAYLARYGRGHNLTAPLYERIMAAVPAGDPVRYGIARYVYGHRYVADRIDDPADVDTVIEAPPTTSEQLLHSYDPDAEPAARLNVTVVGSDEWIEGGSDRKGEAFLRYALENGLAPDRAARAAAGWGADSLRYLRPTDGGNTSYAWVLRWDDAENATEFERALGDYLREIGGETADGYRLGGVPAAIRTPTDRTTVLLVGNRSVVAETEVRVPHPGAVRLALPGGNSAP